MKIIYLHGFNSDGNGSTAMQLKQHYKENIICPSYDYINVDNGYKQLNSIIGPLSKNNDLILCGTSLGGWWTNYFSEKYNIKCILVNPALNPSESLKKFIGITKNFSSGKESPFTLENVKEYAKYKTTESPNVYKTIFLGAKDTLIDPKITAEYFKNRNVIIDQDEEHRLGDVNKLIKLIDETTKSFDKSSLKEHYVTASINDKALKLKYADEVWDILQKSYEKLHGLKTSGFESKENMINKIPLWKMVTRNGKVIAVRMYKDKNGRKAVAAGADGTPEGIEAFKQIGKEDLSQKRSYGEISGPVLAITYKQHPDLEKYCIPYNEVEKIAGEEIKRPQASDPEMIKYPELRSYFYQRWLQDGWHTKIMIGKIGNTIV